MFGAGYVGLVTGACFAELGHEVVVRDVLPERIERLQAGEVPIYEPGLDLVLERNAERLNFTLDVREAVDGADFLFVAVGTGEHVRARLDGRGLTSVGYVSNPEFLAEGSAVADFMKPDRLVVGAFEAEHADRVLSLFRGNEIANVCELVGADVVDVAKGVGLDHRLGPHFLRAGMGFGGSCFPKDVTALKQLAGNSGYPFLLLQAVWEVNELQKRRVVSKLQKHLGSLRGTKIALLGLAFKAHPDDLRGIDLFDTVAETVRDADAAVIVTEWPELHAMLTPEIRNSMSRPV